ncbi:hypothetical protein IAR55_004925 [Kwoniella newhampshirensis]|uniref:Myb-like domain-containing protein n=1 Tax=Kwoniella newhampshirensis TaxID=1651941 RepID=A0AAW0YWX7_9TREE
MSLSGRTAKECADADCVPALLDVQVMAIESLLSLPNNQASANVEQLAEATEGEAAAIEENKDGQKSVQDDDHDQDKVGDSKNDQDMVEKRKDDEDQVDKVDEAERIEQESTGDQTNNVSDITPAPFARSASPSAPSISSAVQVDEVEETTLTLEAELPPLVRPSDLPKPANVHGEWREVEDRWLRQLYVRMEATGENWRWISKEFGGTRTHQQITLRGTHLGLRKTSTAPSRLAKQKRKRSSDGETSAIGAQDFDIVPDAPSDKTGSQAKKGRSESASSTTRDQIRDAQTAVGAGSSTTQSQRRRALPAAKAQTSVSEPSRVDQPPAQAVQVPTAPFTFTCHPNSAQVQPAASLVAQASQTSGAATAAPVAQVPSQVPELPQQPQIPSQTDSQILPQLPRVHAQTAQSPSQNHHGVQIQLPPITVEDLTVEERTLLNILFQLGLEFGAELHPQTAPAAVTGLLPPSGQPSQAYHSSAQGSLAPFPQQTQHVEVDGPRSHHDIAERSVATPIATLNPHDQFLHNQPLHEEAVNNQVPYDQAPLGQATLGQILHNQVLNTRTTHNQDFISQMAHNSLLPNQATSQAPVGQTIFDQFIRSQNDATHGQAPVGQITGNQVLHNQFVQNQTLQNQTSLGQALVNQITHQQIIHNQVIHNQVLQNQTSLGHVSQVTHSQVLQNQVLQNQTHFGQIVCNQGGLPSLLQPLDTQASLLSNNHQQAQYVATFTQQNGQQATWSAPPSAPQINQGFQQGARGGTGGHTADPPRFSTPPDIETFVEMLEMENHGRVNGGASGRSGFFDFQAGLGEIGGASGGNGFAFGNW